MLLSPMRAKTTDDFKKLITRLINGKLISIQTHHHRHHLAIENEPELNALFYYGIDDHLYDINDINEFIKTASDAELDKIELYNKLKHGVQLKTLKYKPAEWQNIKGSESITRLLSDLNFTLFTTTELPVLKNLDNVKQAYHAYTNETLHKSAQLPEEIFITIEHPRLNFTRPSLLKADILKLTTLLELKLRKHLFNAKNTLTDPKAIWLLEKWITEINTNIETSKGFIQFQLDKENHTLSVAKANREALEFVIGDKTLVSYKDTVRSLNARLQLINTEEGKRQQLITSMSRITTISLIVLSSLIFIATFFALGLFAPFTALFLMTATLAVMGFNSPFLKKSFANVLNYFNTKFNASFNPYPEEKSEIQERVSHIETTLVLAEIFAPTKNDVVIQQCAEFKIKEKNSTDRATELSGYLNDIHLQEYLNSITKKDAPIVKNSARAKLFSKPVLAKKMNDGARFGVKSLVELRHRKSAR